MLRFFRNTRRYLVEHGALRKYLFYTLGETLLVVLGILIALQINNWNEVRKNRLQEIKYLAGLKQDLEKDLVQLEFFRIFREDKVSSAKKLLDYDTNDLRSDQVDFFAHLISVLIWLEFSPNENTIEELVNSGNLTMIQNDTLKDQLLGLNQVVKTLSTNLEHSRREFEEFLYDRIGLYIDLNDYSSLDNFIPGVEWTIDSTAVKANSARLEKEASSFLSDRIVRNGLFLAGANNMAMLLNYEEIETRIHEIIRTIDKETL